MLVKEAAMRKAILLVMLAFSLPALAGKIQIDPSPIPLKGTFQVVVAGLQDVQTGNVLVVNVRTGEGIRVPLEAKEGRLLAGPIYALRDCDDAAGKEHVIRVQVGDVIVAATELEEGLSATAVITDPTGEPALTVERWDEGQALWCPSSPLEPGKIRIVVEDPGKDVLCEPESVQVTIRLGGEEKDLDAREKGATSGQFVSELELSIERDGPALKAVLTHKGSEFLSAPLAEDMALTVVYEDLAYSVSLPSLAVRFESTEVVEDTDCPVKLALSEPTDPDEVIWYVDGAERSERGPEIKLIRTEPTYPDSLSVIALVRKGALWGKAEAKVVFVPHTEIEFVQAGSGETAKAPWRCGTPLRVKLAGVYDDAAPRVWVGVLGPSCTVKELALEPKGNGVFVSEPFRPEELSACAGDILWAQYKDPTCLEDVAYTLLRLR